MRLGTNIERYPLVAFFALAFIFTRTGSLLSYVHAASRRHWSSRGCGPQLKITEGV